MKRLLLFLFLFGFATLQAQKAKYVILVSIDGLRPDFYQDTSWPTPNLQRLKAEGAHADCVRGVFPSVTYPSHTTITTGALPIRHGIYYNSPFEPAGETGRWYWEANLVKMPTLWDAVHKAGLRSGAVSWPVTVGAPIDYNIPEVWSLDRTVERFSPTRTNATPKGLVEEVELNATGKLTPDDVNSDYLAVDDNFARAGAYIFKTYKPNLLAVHLVCVDHAQHGEGRDGDHVRAAIAGADHAVGTLWEAVIQAGKQDSTALIITGDHGFVDIHTTLAPNVWLQQNGIIKDRKTDWKAKFHTSGAAAFLHLADKPEGKDKTKEQAKVVADVRKVLESLPAGQRRLFRIIERAELDAIGADPYAVLALAPMPGINMSSSTEGDALRPARGGTHGFFPDFQNICTGFIGYGAGFAKGAVAPQMGLTDVAPIIAKLLQLDFQSPDGVLLPGLLQKAEK